MNWLNILYLDTSEMVIIPFGDPNSGPHRNVLHDAVGAKGASVSTFYTGSLADAIREFQQKQKFNFSLAKLPSSLNEISQLMEQQRNAPSGKKNLRGIITETEVPLERVLEVIASDPRNQEK